MITYYDDRKVRVTSDAIRVAGRSYPLRAVGRVWHVRGARSWSTVVGRGAIGAAILGPLVAAVIGIVVAITVHASTTMTVAAGRRVDPRRARGRSAGRLPAGADGPFLRARRTRPGDVGRGRRATHPAPATADALRFGQIYRAVQRAVEATPAPRR